MNHRSLEYFENALKSVSEAYANGDCDIEDVLVQADKVMCYRKNVGISHKRLEHNPREKAFHDQWQEENAPVSGVNCGHGILQDLFIETSDPFCVNLFRGNRIIEEISPRDRMIVATVIQWLGSNCGMAFLNSALNRFGATISYPKNSSENATKIDFSVKRVIAYIQQADFKSIPVGDSIDVQFYTKIDDETVHTVRYYLGIDEKEPKTQRSITDLILKNRIIRLHTPAEILKGGTVNMSIHYGMQFTGQIFDDNGMIKLKLTRRE